MKASECFGRGRACDLARYARESDDVLVDELQKLHKQNSRAAGVYRRLYEVEHRAYCLPMKSVRGKPTSHSALHSRFSPTSPMPAWSS
jgi:hypothetical protein